MTWDLVILAGWFLAVARITGVLTHDLISESARIWFMHTVGEKSTAAYFVNCSWCVSIWVALFSTPVPVFMAGRTWPQAMLFALGASLFTGMTSGLGRDEDDITLTES